MSNGEKLYGVMAEFETSREILHAARRARAEGYTKMDAHTPHNVEGLADAVGFSKSHISLFILVFALIGGTIGLVLQYWVSVVTYPMNVGGRPLASWPAFIPTAFEITILSGVIGGLIGLFVLNRFPQPYHPVFNVPEFDRASQDRFFLVIEAEDPKFDLEATRQFLESMDPWGVYDVEA